jgi:hypothetical protein
VTAVAALEKLSFKRLDYLTDGKGLVRVQMILPNGMVLVENAMTGEEEHMDADKLQGWKLVDRKQAA